ncbi:MAG TPA: PBP1A family penicillin-binding protein [Actinomycetota bacterium]
MNALPRSSALRRSALVVVLCALPALAGCEGLPNLDEALADASRVAETTKVFAADGSLITELHAEENREVIPLSDVPEHVVDAVIAIEDARFYEHNGIDIRGILRALSVNAAEGRVVEGGSTITQQLVKKTLTGDERTFERKVKEAFLAYQLEDRFSKDEILERYLNTVYFGRGAYGIQAAAEVFFGKNAKALTLAEGALLAGMIRSPNRYDPAERKVGKARRATVLNRMLEEGWVTEEQARRAKATPIKLARRHEVNAHAYGYFVDYVKQQIFDDAERFGVLGETRADRIDAVFKGGLRIYTTLDPKLQDRAEQSAETLLPYGSDPYTSFVGVSPADGHIVTMVGGRGFFRQKDPYAKLNLAVRRRQPGSSFKPFTLVAALEKGIPLSRVYQGGSRITLRLSNGQYWSPANYGLTSFGSSLSLLRATAYSVNVVYAQVVLEVGPQKVVNVAHRMGIESNLDAVPAIALGTEEVTPLEQAQAYATLANQGERVDLTAVTKITDSAGTVLWEHEPKRKRVLAEPVAALATEALQEVMKTGTGRNLVFGRPVAGKTGTSEEYADAWFAGFTPDYVGVAWVGFPQGQIAMRPPRTRILVYGSSWPGQMWQRWMDYAHRGMPIADFPVAEDLMVEVKVDVSRGCLPNAFTPPYLIQTRSFLKGAEPKDVCTEPTSGEIPSTPDVIGEPSSEARTTLLHAGFAVATVSIYCPAFPPGTVCDQNPLPGTAARVGESATIYVSNDDAVALVPMVLGRTLSRARQKLIDAGYKVKVVVGTNSDNGPGCRDVYETESGRVWRQSPCAGSKYGYGSTVTIFVNP